MINFNTELTQTDAKWVLDQWYIFDHRICHPTLSKIMECHNKVFKESVSIAGCSCEHRAQHAVWTSRLNQYKNEINNIANPVTVQEVTAPVKNTRKKKATE
jgi:hypothetical protein